jgi:hypothetical protein
VSVLTPTETLIAARRLAGARPHLAAVAGIVHHEDLWQLCRDELTGVDVRIDGWDIRGRWFGVVVGPRGSGSGRHVARRVSRGRVAPAFRCARRLYPGSTWPGLRRELDRIALGTFTGPAGTFRQRTELSKTQRDILAQLKIEPPPRIYQLTAPAP